MMTPSTKAAKLLVSLFRRQKIATLADLLATLNTRLRMTVQKQDSTAVCPKGSGEAGNRRLTPYPFRVTNYSSKWHTVLSPDYHIALKFEYFL